MTLIELIIALSLVSVIVLGLSSINLFSHFQVTSSDRRAKIQNEATQVLEHMTKEISKAIGNEAINGADSVVNILSQINEVRTRVYIDANLNGQREAPIVNPLPGQDHWIAYRHITGGGVYNVEYCSRCPDANCVFAQCMDSVEVLSRNINSFIPNKPVNGLGQLNSNATTIQLTACWNPQAASLPNGTADNPCVNMNTSIKMPSVSAN